MAKFVKVYLGGDIEQNWADKIVQIPPSISEFSVFVDL
jgi:hypothetical protein